MVVPTTWPERDQSPRGGTWINGSRLRQANASAAASCWGKRAADSARSWVVLRGTGEHRAAWSSPPRGRRRRNAAPYSGWALSCWVRTRWASGRSTRQSSAVTTWTVPRCTVRRTTRRSRRSDSSSVASKSTRRDHSPTYGSFASWACRPTSARSRRTPASRRVRAGAAAQRRPVELAERHNAGHPASVPAPNRPMGGS